MSLINLVMFTGFMYQNLCAVRRKLLDVLPARGGDSNVKMPGCVCQKSENVPILNDTFSR